jgi:hypothetical protein
MTLLSVGELTKQGFVATFGENKGLVTDMNQQPLFHLDRRAGLYSDTSQN